MIHDRAVCIVTILLSAWTVGCTDWGDRPAASAGDVFELAGERFTVETVASDLRVPWTLAWTPDGRLLITERPGRLMVVEPGGRQARLLADVPGVDHAGEHGLMGMALSPNFAADGFIFLSYTARKEGRLINRITRFTLTDAGLTEAKILIDDLPAGDYHDGLPLRFGPDGMLYASTGDAIQGRLAQQPASLAGKFLRITADGAVPADNPRPDSPVWSLGHRNCQGFDWRPGSGELYATEHGPSVPLDSLVGGGDELNLIERGGNYGWPTYHHDKNAPGFIAPLKQWTPAIAPAGATFYDGDKFLRWQNLFFFTGLRGQALWAVRFSRTDPGKIEMIARGLHKSFGRLRAVAQGPDGYLYITTSNRDGRGKPAPQDDRVLRLVPARPGRAGRGATR